MMITGRLKLQRTQAVPSTVLGGRDQKQQVRLQAPIHMKVTLGLSLGLRRNMKPDLMIVSIRTRCSERPGTVCGCGRAQL